MLNITALPKTNQADLTWSCRPCPTTSDVDSAGANKHETFSQEEDIFQWALLQLYGNQVLRDTDGLGLPAIKTLPERVAGLLLFLGREQNGLIRNLSPRTLADSVDAERETVISILRAFRRQGIIRFGYRQIEIVDVESLEDLASE